MEQGDYLRTIGGHIGRIECKGTQLSIDFKDDHIVETPISGYFMNVYYNFTDERDFWTADMIKKHGKRLIDVVEVGDLVNGRFVVGVNTDTIDLLTDTDLGISLENDEIISVICHEVLEREAYDGR